MTMTHLVAQILRAVADVLDPPALPDLSTAQARRRDAITAYARAEAELFAAAANRV
jgi:hypothetical protein